ncbi:MAG: hypothetical protein J2P46_17055 [Zavarzinella sp.]|nr:hypothetical protein [Zavarzinella sp.]
MKRPSALGNGHVIAELTDHAGQREQVAVEESFLVRRAGRTFLPVWFISQEPGSKLVQVELPQEAASGVNRIWVQPQKVFEGRTEGAAV